jgi:hypothetical protein
MVARKNLRAPLSTVLDCAHANKETKTSLLSAQESVGVSIKFASRFKAISATVMRPLSRRHSSSGAKCFRNTTIRSLLYCAHASKKETKTSLLNTEEVVNVGGHLISHQAGCVKSL